MCQRLVFRLNSDQTRALGEKKRVVDLGSGRGAAEDTEKTKKTQRPLAEKLKQNQLSESCLGGQSEQSAPQPA